MNALYVFPKLADYLTKQGINSSEFARRANNISHSPGARTWVNAKKKGVKEVTAYKMQKILKKMDFPEDVLQFEKVNNESD